MERKRVALITDRTLLATGIQRLLEGSDSLEVLALSPGSPDYQERLKSFAPAVILVDSDESPPEEHHALRHFDTCPDATVGALNASHTDLQLFRRDRVVNCTPDDLIQIIGRA